MITPAEIVRKAERKYRAVLRAWVGGEESFPLDFPVGRLSKNLAERRRQIEALQQESAEVRGAGYQIKWKTVKKAKLGKQTSPQRIIIPSLPDYLALLRKQTEFEQFATDVAYIRERLPALESWLQSSPHLVIDYHGQWPALLTVCDYFIQQPRPNLYIRELPIPVHTKFIETNIRILRLLFDELLPPHIVDSNVTDFHARFGLKDKPTLIRLRLLDEQLTRLYGLKVDDMSLPVEQVAHLHLHIKPQQVIIVENLVNFLTLPPLPNSVGLFGGGFAVHLLRHIGWLAQCHILYWGDIDAHGFQILSDLRGLLPHVQSLMMDEQTLTDNAAFVVEGVATRTERYHGLSAAEAKLAQHVQANNIRLEQEHIPHQYALERIAQALAENDAAVM